MNECLSRPCGNGGSCVDELNSFSCQCPPGVTGISHTPPASTYQSLDLIFWFLRMKLHFRGRCHWPCSAPRTRIYWKCHWNCNLIYLFFFRMSVKRFSLSKVIQQWLPVESCFNFPVIQKPEVKDLIVKSSFLKHWLKMRERGCQMVKRRPTALLHTALAQLCLSFQHGNCDL